MRLSRPASWAERPASARARSSAASVLMRAISASAASTSAGDWRRGCGAFAARRLSCVARPPVWEAAERRRDLGRVDVVAFGDFPNNGDPIARPVGALGVGPIFDNLAWGNSRACITSRYGANSAPIASPRLGLAKPEFCDDGPPPSPGVVRSETAAPPRARI